MCGRHAHECSETCMREKLTICIQILDHDETETAWQPAGGDTSFQPNRSGLGNICPPTTIGGLHCIRSDSHLANKPENACKDNCSSCEDARDGLGA